MLRAARLMAAPNILARDFLPSAPNEVWASDITYHPTQEGWLYLAGVMDLFSRCLVGFCLDTSLETKVAINALKMAIWHRKPSPGLIHHSDQGCQYRSVEYQNVLKYNQMICSMSRRGNCHDNAVKESFFSTLKIELVKTKKWHSIADLKKAVIDYIVAFYNLERRHSTLGYVSPIDFEYKKCSKLAAS